MMSCYSVGKLLVLQHLTLQSEINIGIQILSSPEMNRIGGVMVSILPLSVLPSVQDIFRRIFLSNC
jgi:hypothetical protein